MTDITHPDLERYATEHSSPEPPLLAELAAATRDFSASHGMMVGRLEGRFLKMLVAAIGARRVLEVGTFTGYSALSMAEALPADGEIVTCELDERHAEMARRFIARSPFADQIHVRLGSAAETLAGLDGPFDLCFIDADKVGYRAYYEHALRLVRRGGLICLDNVLWSGRVIDPADQSADTVALREFNTFIAGDGRVECVMVPIRDGVTVARRV